MAGPARRATGPCQARREGAALESEFTEIYRQHAGDVYRFVLYLTGDRSLADDLTSETFVRLWTARERVDLATVRAYLFTIARNLFLQGRRGARPERAAAELAEWTADARPGPAARAEARDELRATLAALQSLPEIDRAALLMRAESDLPYEEIGASLGLSPITVRVKVHRARLKLAELRLNAGRPDRTTESSTENPR